MVTRQTRGGGCPAPLGGRETERSRMAGDKCGRLGSITDGCHTTETFKNTDLGILRASSYGASQTHPPPSCTERPQSWCSFAPVPATVSDLQLPSTAGREERQHGVSLSGSSRILLGLCAQALPESVWAASLPSHIPVFRGPGIPVRSHTYPGADFPQVLWNFSPGIDSFPTSYNSFPSILPSLCFNGGNWPSSEDHTSREGCEITLSQLRDLRVRK